jgi:choline dehydrogenase-like flavoprotein
VVADDIYCSSTGPDEPTLTICADTYIDAFESAGIPLRTDGGTDGSNVGFSWVLADLDPVNGTRMSSRKAYWDPASDRPNLSILVNTYVATVALHGPQAIGVNAIGRRSNETLLIGADKEVILAAGAAHTPQILQLSGIGPKDLLESLEIDVAVDLPGVGSNFQDHLAMTSNWMCKRPCQPCDGAD